VLQPLIKRLLRPVFNPRSRTGLLLDRHCVWIAGIDSEDDGGRLTRERRIGLNYNSFAQDAGVGPINAAGNAIADFFKSTDDGRYQAIRIALPDPAVNFAVFELDAIPKTRRERDELARWLFKKELYLDTDQLACISQDLGMVGGKRLLLGAVLQQAWISGIVHAVQTAGLFPASLGVSALSIFNALLKTPGINSGGAALITLETSFWSLLLWDEHRHPRFMRGYWRDKAGAVPDDELRAIAAEAERLITSYVRTSSEHRIGKVYLAGGDTNVSRFAGLLNERLSEQAEYVDFSSRCRDAVRDLPACCYTLCGDA
jgi:hypothetical protein